jgi:AcrR family transcriptional regulator
MGEQHEPTRRKRGSLTAEEILDAAERVAATGIDSLTVRAVAARLGASPMALYRYFPTKDALVEALLDRVLARIPLPQQGPWDRELRELALAHSRTLAMHPWAVGPLFAHPSPGMSTLRLGEVFLGILARGGLVGEDAVGAFGAVLALNFGRAAFAASAPDSGLPPVDPGAFPHTAASSAALAGYASDAMHARALDLLLAGIGASARTAHDGSGGAS